MRHRKMNSSRWRLFMLLVTMCPFVSNAQFISLKTAPVATGDQFLIFPSRNLGMGGVSIALYDELHDPFVNPAKGIRMKGSLLFSSPTCYHVTGDNGGARTLPLGILYGSEKWFGGVAFSMQQLDVNNADRFQQLLSEKSSSNLYAFGSFGMKIPGSSTAIGASIFWADLTGIDGVDMLYPRSREIMQYGHIVDSRMGLFNERDDERGLEVLLLHHRVDMTHDVTYEEWIWNESTFQSVLSTRKEKNPDRSNTWGIHLGYQRPLSQSDWRIGGLLTGNWKSHPKIPNYELMNIPRDPGNTIGYNVGLGLSHSLGHGAFGVDVIYEPIWSHTWAEAAESFTTQRGRMIVIGGKTVENHFKFSNSLLRVGISQEGPSFGFQLGLQMRSIRYWLDQSNYIEEFKRRQHEHWVEWILNLGLILKFQEFQVRYLGRLTQGTGLPGVAGGGFRDFAMESRSADFIIAPSGPLTLQDVTVFTHQITVSMPIE